MIPRSSRLAIWCLALLLSLSLYYKGRAPTVNGGSAALFRSQQEITVRLSGDFPRPGLYLFPKGISAQAAIKMTLPDAPLATTSGARTPETLHSGDIVTLKLAGDKAAVFTVLGMGAKEKMLLAIPLDVDRLGDEEWSLLPGIGPVLSARIAADRHKYGAFRSLEGLLRVPGIGPGKIEVIRKYF